MVINLYPYGPRSVPLWLYPYGSCTLMTGYHTKFLVIDLKRSSPSSCKSLVLVNPLKF